MNSNTGTEPILPVAAWRVRSPFGQHEPDEVRTAVAEEDRRGWKIPEQA